MAEYTMTMTPEYQAQLERQHKAQQISEIIFDYLYDFDSEWDSGSKVAAEAAERILDLLDTTPTT